MKIPKVLKQVAVAAVALAAFAVAAVAKDGQIAFQGANTLDGPFHISCKQDGKNDFEEDMEFAKGTTEAEAADMVAAKLKTAGYSGVSSAGGSVFVLGCKEIDCKEGKGSHGKGNEILNSLAPPAGGMKQKCERGTDATSGILHCTYGAKDFAVFNGMTGFVDIPIALGPTDTTQTINDRIMLALAAEGVNATRLSIDTIQVTTFADGRPIHCLQLIQEGRDEDDEALHRAVFTDD